ncbi:hypothetical protein BsWGS_17354 [Bradybaena similaris]
MAPVTLTLSLLLLVTAGVFAEKFDFHGYELLSVFARNIVDVEILAELGEKHPELDFWLEPAPQKNTTVLVPPQFLQEFKDAVTEQHMPMVVMSDDVQSIIDAGSERTPEHVVESKRQASGNIIDHQNYHTYSKIRDFLNQVAAKYPNNVRVSNLNYLTSENRPVVVVRLTGSAGTNKPVIILEAGIHAREWISPAANLWFIEKVLRDYAAGDATAKSLLDKYDWHIVPVTNPDGYEYTHSTYRLWRKNRRYIRSSCYGVDLNRNFDVAFGTTGVSTSCSSDIYPGTAAFSEPETANIRDLFNSLVNQVVAYVSIHSYSQYVLVPWGYTNYVSRPSNQVELDRVTKLMTTAISQKHGKQYLHGTAYQLLNYAASGSSADWVLVRKPNLYSVAFELRPAASASNGFVLPASQIVASGEEYYASLIVLAQQAKT